MKLILLLVLSLIKLIETYYPYTSLLQIRIKNKNYNPIISLMNLNKVLNENQNKNNLIIKNYNNKSHLFSYNTYSYLDEYKYKILFLIKDKNTYLIKYEYNTTYDTYKYLMLIKSKDISPLRKHWCIYVKYNNLIINKQITERIIIKEIINCISKNEILINDLLINDFS